MTKKLLPVTQEDISAATRLLDRLYVRSHGDFTAIAEEFARHRIESTRLSSPPLGTVGEDHGWRWLDGFAEQRFKEAAEDVTYGADHMVDAYLAGAEAALSSREDVEIGRDPRLEPLWAALLPIVEAYELNDCDERDADDALEIAIGDLRDLVETVNSYSDAESSLKQSSGDSR